MDLFDTVRKPVARARATDPDTSRAAAENVERSGNANAQRSKCRSAVVSWPGSTAAEIAKKAGLERHAASRRLPELRDAGLVRNGEPRLCTVMGTAAMTWWPEHGQGD